MAFQVHPLFSTYPGASFVPLPGNFSGPQFALSSGGPSAGYWGHVPLEPPQPGQWGEVPAMVAMREGRGTGTFGGVGGQMFNYGWPKYGPMPLKPELGGFVGKLNPYGRSFPYGFYKTPY
ncbi:hypothetical protein M231_01245 [Tremella mesenterica]|uniref:Uncharacterized protein n=1 Tax=Tremella mesenterica TaxID=5217 RepID=A0A4V1M4U0_TREME|nr:uncharacterized protein TREMEDRAFT_69622 [Tremella mesenterica DSM 1558]EIW67537.1 hypothetical protein TREMEDRAFT_69622 [Tremella mesenterica DSM 1558]RXK41537.1 hypothetical protein M231_01245 [Tremella mesenterica]